MWQRICQQGGSKLNDGNNNASISGYVDQPASIFLQSIHAGQHENPAVQMYHSYY